MANYLIIGASTGIGKTLALKLAEDGHQILGSYFKNKVLSEHPFIHDHPLNVLEDLIVPDYLPEAISGIIYCPGSIHLRPFDRIKPHNTNTIAHLYHSLLRTWKDFYYSGYYLGAYPSTIHCPHFLMFS